MANIAAAQAHGEQNNGVLLTHCLQIWEYQGRVIQKPTVCVQTLYGHSGTVTGLFVYGPHIVSSSTDKTIKIWKAVDGRQQLVYPWYNLQVRVKPTLCQYKGVMYAAGTPRQHQQCHIASTA
jgi:WD40 repeat protein